MAINSASVQDHADETVIRSALALAHPNALRMALYQATGDEELAAMPVVRQGIDHNWIYISTISDQDAARVREKAFDFLAGRRSDTKPLPDDAEVSRLIELYHGGTVSEAMFEAGKEELKFEEFPRGVEWDSMPSDEAKAAFPVVVVGAGIGGLTAGVQLDRLGIPFTIIERNGGVGGTWLVNDYPDARVDIASHNYQVSYMKKYPWKHYYATQSELKEYLEEIADRFDLKRNIRFNTEMVEALWDESSASWQIKLRKADGTEERITAKAVISAAGLFNAVNLPDIPGIDSFRGKMFHTTAWDHGYDHVGKRIGVIGVGSTGAQLIPKLAKDAAQLAVFQRTPQWISQRQGYLDPIPEELHWLFDSMPHYWNWYCFSTFHNYFYNIDGLVDFDPEWQKQGGLVSERNDNLRKHLMVHLEAKIGHRPELMRKLIPDYPPFSRRVVADNGWFETLLRSNVELVTEGIERITPAGIRTRDGKERDLDLIVLGAGFKTDSYCWPVRYQGRGGVTLEQQWEADGARAYLGLTVPNFPNFFIMYGPNSQVAANGLMSWLEVWAGYAVKAIATLIERGASSMAIRDEVHDHYNVRLDEALRGTTWSEGGGGQGGSSYYVNAHGRTGVNMPFPPEEFHSWVRRPNLDDFEIR